MRSRVLLMVALLAVAGVMAAMAYTEAEVRNPAEATIVRTDVALLALSCNENGEGKVGYLDENCWLDNDGRLHLNFAKGLSEPGEPGVAEPVVTDVKAEAESDGGDNPKDRWYEVDLTDDENHKFRNLKTKEKRSYEVKDFNYDIDGRCIDYTFRARTKYHYGGQYQWETVSGTLCIPADHEHEGEPGDAAPGFYGFQPDSTYTFNELVKVTNNSEDTINVTASLTGDIVDESDLDIAVSGEGGIDYLDGDFVRLGPGESTFISFKFDVPGNFAELHDVQFEDGTEAFNFGGVLTVSAVAVE